MVLSYIFSEICHPDSYCTLFLIKWMIFIFFCNFLQNKITLAFTIFMKYITGDLEEVPMVKMASSGYKAVKVFREVPALQNLAERFSNNKES